MNLNKKKILLGSLIFLGIAIIGYLFGILSYLNIIIPKEDSLKLGQIGISIPPTIISIVLFIIGLTKKHYKYFVTDAHPFVQINVKIGPFIVFISLFIFVTTFIFITIWAFVILVSILLLYVLIETFIRCTGILQDKGIVLMFYKNKKNENTIKVLSTKLINPTIYFNTTFLFKDLYFNEQNLEISVINVKTIKIKTLKEFNTIKRDLTLMFK